MAGRKRSEKGAILERQLQALELRKAGWPFHEIGDRLGITKPELRAAINALDTWLNDNAAAANAALPQPARGALTVEQKAALLSYVIARRYLMERKG